MLDLTNRRKGEVMRAQRALAAKAARDPFGHRKVHEECKRGNPYMLAKLARMGLTYEGGAIRRKESS